MELSFWALILEEKFQGIPLIFQKYFLLSANHKFPNHNPIPRSQHNPTPKHQSRPHLHAQENFWKIRGIPWKIFFSLESIPHFRYSLSFFMIFEFLERYWKFLKLFLLALALALSLEILKFNFKGLFVLPHQFQLCIHSLRGVGSSYWCL